MEDECRDADCGKQRPHVHFGQQRHHESNGSWACPQALVPCPRCPDLLVPRHIRVQDLLHLPRAPHGDRGGSDLIGCGSLGALSHRICVALQHDQPGCPRRMCCREQGTGRDRADAREEDRFTTREIVQHCGDAVGPLLQGRQRARRDGIRRSGARLVEENQSTERCHRLDPPSKRGLLRKVLTIAEPHRDEHYVARTFT
jgi:hypothetical protein